METFKFLGLLSNFSVLLVPFSVGVFRWRKMNSLYRPLIFILAFGIIVEVIRAFQLYNYYANAGWSISISLLGYNLYVLFISIAYTILFNNFGLFGSYKRLPYFIIALFIIIWILEHLVINGFQIHSKTTYFRLCYSTILCIYAIQQINVLIVSEKRVILKNPLFLICIGLLFFFVPYIISEGVFLFYSRPSLDFGTAVSFLRKWTSLLMYLIFTLALLWIPPKKPFIQLS
jgi:hypothetical protein